VPRASPGRARDGRSGSAAVADFFRLDDLLSDEELALRERVREFCMHEVRPVINDYWERAEFPFPLLEGYARLGIAGGTIRGWGCPGLGQLAAGMVAKELAMADGSFSTFHGVHSGLAMTSLALLGSDEQRADWLPRMARVEAIGAFGLTEPTHGSDAVSLETRAERIPGGYRITGRKRWIGNATFADVIVLWARDDEGDVGAFLVERGTPGLAPHLITGKAAKRASWQAEVELAGACVPESARLPGATGFADATRVLTSCRPLVAWGALGHAEAAYEAALAHATEREQFGRPLAGFQLVQYRLAGMLAEVTSLQALLTRMSQLAEAGALTEGMASLAKMTAASRARGVVADARDILGGDGILLERDVARHQGDAEVVFTVEGTDSVQALIVGREITGLAAFT
jgi:glutaryl-CoA dehydrogenase